MNVKTKAIGFIAGSALALGVVGGVLADGADTTVTLDGAAGGVCSAIVTESTATFGPYTYNSSTGLYELAASGSATDSLTVAVSQNIGPGAVCDVDVKGSDLVTTPPNGDPIEVSNIAVANGATSIGALSSIDQSFANDVAAGNLTANLTLTTPASTQPIGDYAGTITFTASTGA